MASPLRTTIGLLILTVGAAVACTSATATSGPVPSPAVDLPKPANGAPASMVLSGGCFWGIQAVFQHVRGVTRATSGYAGGEASTAHYEIVETGTTGHAESVEITYDPAVVTYGQLLRVFFSVAHDPTELNRQGPDTGTQYRSVIFYATPDEQRVATAYIAQLDQAHVFRGRIVTAVSPLKGFYAAEDYHQDYARLHPSDLYIVINDAPKVANLKREFPDLYRDVK
jgi:peptide-methionine (S)-S-oxide reductase